MAELVGHPKYKLLVFGGGGAIGHAIMEGALSRGWDVVATTRKLDLPKTNPREREGSATWITVDPFAEGFSPSVLRSNGPYSAVCWANGANMNDNIYSLDQVRHCELYKANCLFILLTLKKLSLWNSTS